MAARQTKPSGKDNKKAPAKRKPKRRRAPKKVVIGGWLSQADGDAFNAYALEIGIDSAALATLLIVRELNDPRIAGILDPEALKVVRKERRISARTARVKLKRMFAIHAAKHGVSSDGAAAAIFRAEVEERWLGKCVAKAGNQVDSREE